MKYQKPILIKSEEFSDYLEFRAEGVLIKKNLNIEQNNTPNFVIPWSQVYDLLTPTMFGLLEDLSPGSPIFSEFYKEWTQFESIMLSQNTDFQQIPGPSYGEWFYYPTKNHLVRFAPQKWHETSLLVRNSCLIYPKQQDFNWEEARKKLNSMVLAVAGASVGSQMLHTTNMLLRPSAIKVADAKNYQLNNANRVRLAYYEFGSNKAEVVSDQLHATNPFQSVFTYSEGIHEQNISQFVGGNQNEPKASIVIEETDDIDMKILLREQARRLRIPVVMVTDIGRAAQVDVRRFDLDPNISLVVGMSDEDLFRRKKIFDTDPGNRKMFLDLVFAMSGQESIFSVEDFKKVLLHEVEPTFAGIPQLGSAASMAAGLSAWIICKIMMEEQTPERILLDPNKNSFSTIGGAK